MLELTDLLPQFEETVVYDNDAIRPAYLIVYGKASKGNSKSRSWISRLLKTPKCVSILSDDVTRLA